MCVKGWSWLKPGPSHPQLLQGWLSVGWSRTTCAHDSGKHWADRAVHRVGPKNQASTNLVAAQRVWKKLYQDPGFLWGSSCSCFLQAKKLFCALWLLSHQTANRKSIAQCPNNSSSLSKCRPGSPECTCFPHLLQATEPGPQMYFGAASECHWTWQTAAGGNLCRASWKAVSSHLHWNPLSSDQTAWPEERDTYPKGKSENSIAAGLVESTPDRGWVILSVYGQTKANFIPSSPGYVVFFFVCF